MQSYLSTLYEDNNTLPWYHGKLTNEEVSYILTENGRSDGLFIVTDSITHDGDFTLNLCYEGRVIKYRIYCYKYFLSLDNFRFHDTLEDLINYNRNVFTSDSILETKLIKYVVKTANTDLISWPQIRIHKVCFGGFNKIILGALDVRRVALSPVQYIEGAKRLIEKCIFHENLVNLLGLTCNGDEFYLVSEHSQYKCLEELLRLRKYKKVIKENMLFFAYDISCGMEYLEKMQVTNKQLATKNVFINRRGIAKLGNFALAEEMTEITVQYFLRWAAPESIRSKIYNSRTDVWSYGVCIWEIYTFGRVPYDTLRHDDLYTKLRDGYRLPIPENCDEDLAGIMKSCWQWRADDRTTFLTVKKALQEKKRQSYALPGTSTESSGN